jgi:hypothetical protein
MMPQTLLSIALPMLISYVPLWIVYGVGLALALQSRERFPKAYKFLIAAFGIFLLTSFAKYASFLGIQYLMFSEKLATLAMGTALTVLNCGGLLFDLAAWGLLFYGIFFAPRDGSPVAVE